MGVLELAVLHGDACYNVPNFKLSGRVCKTNHPSNTTFRAFGRPQIIQLMETIIAHCSFVTGIPDHCIRATNLYKEGDYIPQGMQLRHCRIPHIWDKLFPQYQQLREEVDEYNQKN